MQNVDVAGTSADAVADAVRAVVVADTTAGTAEGTIADTLAARVSRTVRDIPDFPTSGVLFKDITPVLSDAALLREVIVAMAGPHTAAGITHVVGIESRGFLFGVPIALELGCAFVPARKPGKLPYQTVRESYALEYRDDMLEMHQDALGRGARVLVVDDVLATGGTASAATRLVSQLGGSVTAIAVLIELGFLNGRRALGNLPVHSLITY
ncbi:MAG TPA: adenine phosphoribosyltransferase [Gemmatimonas sp.]|nr:adenine phosphoribosyltransferase [Gemmatimonas sp.]